MTPTDPETPPECECFWLPESQWLSAASCGYGGGYEPGSQMEWNPDCPVHIPTGTTLTGGEVGTGVSGGDDPALTEATLWVNRSVDYPEAPAQAHLPAEPTTTTSPERAEQEERDG